MVVHVRQHARHRRNRGPQIRVLLAEPPSAEAAHRVAQEVHAIGIDGVLGTHELDHVQHVLLAQSAVARFLLRRAQRSRRGSARAAWRVAGNRERCAVPTVLCKAHWRNEDEAVPLEKRRQRRQAREEVVLIAAVTVQRDDERHLSRGIVGLRHVEAIRHVRARFREAVLTLLIAGRRRLLGRHRQ